MRTLLTICMAAGLFLLPFASEAQVSGSQDAQTRQAPPVAQTLVREGDFAIKLAVRYELGSPASEAEAESLLASVGVLPRNGWISDYPVTPEILGQIGDSAEQAAQEGKLSMKPEEARGRLYDLAQQQNLPVPAGEQTGAPGPQAAPESYAVEDYYAGSGPPIITYYPPPPAYLYLYAWVPYPAWWYGFWYPGFYICNSFTTTVVVDSRTAFVRNRYVDPVTRHVVQVDPVVRGSGGTVLSRTVLRTADGRTFRTVNDLRRSAASAGAGNGTPGVTSGSGGFRSLEDRRSAQNLYSRSIERQSGQLSSGRYRGSAAGTWAPYGRGGRPYSGTDGRQYRRTAPDGERLAPASPARQYAPRQYEQRYQGSSESQSSGNRPSYAPSENGRGGSYRRNSQGWRDDDGSWSGRGGRWSR
jgi:hypothetical protein